MEEKLNAILESLNDVKQGQDLLNVRMERLEGNQDLLAQKFIGFNEKLVGFEGKLNGFDEKLDRFEQKQDGLGEKLDNFTIETRSGFKHVQVQLDGHKRIFELITTGKYTNEH